MKQFTPVHGQWITCEINGVKIKNARVSIATVGNVYICHNSRLLLDYKVINRLGFNHAYYIGYIGGGGLFFIAPEVKNLKPATPRKTKAEKVREARAKKRIAESKEVYKKYQKAEEEYRKRRFEEGNELLKNGFATSAESKFIEAKTIIVKASPYDNGIRIELESNPYKELVEKVKEKIDYAHGWAEWAVDKNTVRRRPSMQAAYRMIKQIKIFIDQEEKKINKT
jgi:hypothetical protein